MGAMEPPLSDSSAGRWRYLTRLEVTVKDLAVGMEQPTGGTLLYSESVDALRPGAFASVGLGVDNAP